MIVRVAELADDNTLAFAPAILWLGKDTIDESTEYAYTLAKWRKQFNIWCEKRARPLRLDEDKILKAISNATPW